MFCKRVDKGEGEVEGEKKECNWQLDESQIVTDYCSFSSGRQVEEEEGRARTGGETDRETKGGQQETDTTMQRRMKEEGRRKEEEHCGQTHTDRQVNRRRRRRRRVEREARKEGRKEGRLVSLFVSCEFGSWDGLTD